MAPGLVDLSGNGNLTTEMEYADSGKQGHATTVNGLNGLQNGMTEKQKGVSTDATMCHMDTHGSVASVPPPGVWAPAITFFDHSTDSLSLGSQAQYFSYLARSGLAGLVILGTNAETFLLTQSERKQLLQTARKACGPSYPIMAGVSGHSTKQVLEYIADAAAAGANYALLLPPSYFGKQSTMDVIEDFYHDVATESVLPIVIYNMPGVSSGIDLTSAFMVRLAQAHKNIVGVKLTCGAVAKVSRLSATFPASRFAVYAGQSDFMLGGLASGATGTIAGFANVFPKTIVRIYDLYQSGRFEEALKLHQTAALAEQGCKDGIATVKYAAARNTAKAAGIDETVALDQLRPRRPYKEPSDKAKNEIEALIAPLIDIERACST